MREALYRKYRPKKLSDVFGQSHITTTLTNALQSKRISHGYLFSGPRGVGKTSIARILAYQVNDFKYGDPTAKLDIIEIDAASNRRIDEIRDLRDKVNLAPVVGKYKVYIIDEVHMLTKEAFNALLKTLEEPPMHVIFILATTESAKVPETIISRTQHFNFKAIENSEIVNHLKALSKKEGLNIDITALKLIADHSEGSFRDAISILDQLSNEPEINEQSVENLLGIPPQKIIKNIINLASTGQIKKLIDELSNTNQLGIDPKRLCIAIVDQILNDIKSSDSSSISTLALKLIDASNSSDPYRSLELNLVDYSLHFNLTAPKVSGEVVHKKAPIKNSSVASLTKTITNDLNKKEIKKPTKANIAQNQDSSSQNLSTTNNIWPKLLNKLKNQYSTLYAVARMAKVNYNDEGILLTVDFPFHQRRLLAEKNLLIINKFIKELNGEPIKLTVELSSSADRSTPVIEKDNNEIDDFSLKENSLSNIKNIFGGGEILET